MAEPAARAEARLARHYLAEQPLGEGGRKPPSELSGQPWWKTMG